MTDEEKRAFVYKNRAMVQEIIALANDLDTRIAQAERNDQMSRIASIGIGLCEAIYHLNESQECDSN